MTLPPQQIAVFKSAPVILGKVLLGIATKRDVDQMVNEVKTAKPSILREALSLPVIPAMTTSLFINGTKVECSSDGAPLNVGDALRILMQGTGQGVVSRSVSDNNGNALTPLGQTQLQQAQQIANTQVGNHLIFADLFLSEGEGVSHQWFVSRAQHRVLAEKLSNLSATELSHRLATASNAIVQKISSPEFARNRPGLNDWIKLINIGAGAVIEALRHPAEDTYQTLRSNAPANLFVGLIDDNQRQEIWDGVIEDLQKARS